MRLSPLPPPFFDRKSRGKPDNKFTAAYDNYGKRQTYGKFTAVNGKLQIHIYYEFIISLKK